MDKDEFERKQYKLSFMIDSSPREPDKIATECIKIKSKKIGTVVLSKDEAIELRDTLDGFIKKII